jgi:glycosyltransferase involved in cell wall biosynthesis
LRLAVYSDFPYRRSNGRVYAEQAFVVFLCGLAEFLDGLTLVGRLDPDPAAWHFRVPGTVAYQPLPHYARLSRPFGVLSATARSARRFWRLLDETDTALLFGPNPLAVVFALMTLCRRRRLALGVRQDYLVYVGARHPGNAPLLLAARLLDGAFRLLARRSAVLVVGPVLAEHYSRAARLLDVNVVLVGDRDVVAGLDQAAHGAGTERVVLSVGRLDNEKNPLLLADVLAELCLAEPTWRMVVCGEGPLKDRLRERLERLGVAGQAELRGFVPMGTELREIYRASDFLLHVSHTEGVPQVLFEAFAAGLPIVATDVGGVRRALGDAGLLVGPDDAPAAAAALRRLAEEDCLRERLVEAGLERIRASTRERQCAKVVDFLRASGGEPPRA